MQKISYQGKPYEFPDDATLDEINAFVGTGVSSGMPSGISDEKRKSFNQLSNVYGTERSGIDTLRDIAAGALRAGQNIAATLGEAGQAIGSLANPLRKYIPESMKVIPDVNIREELGLSGAGQVDLGRYIEGRQPNPVLQGLSQYAGGAILGGSTARGQIAGNALWGALQGQPDESHLGGFLPEGRVGAAIAGGTLAAIPAAIGKSIPYIRNAIEYMKPGKSAERFRSSFGSGTSAENISELSRRAGFASGSREEQALIPKREIYAEHGGSDVYRYPPGSLPEENMQRFAGMLSPEDKFSEQQISSLTRALKDYRSGKMTGEMKGIGGNPEEIFMHRAEDILNIPELPDNAVARIEDVLSMPTRKGSRYFSDPDVTSAYSPKGKLMELHNKYRRKSTLDNYDDLQSEMKTEARNMEERTKLSDTAQVKLDQLNANIRNLDNDSKSFMTTLPEKMQNLELDFRTKYASFAKTYKPGKSEKGPSITLQRLAGGRPELVDDNAIIEMFSHTTKADMDALRDMGPSATRNIIYAALQKIKPGDAEGLAERLLDLRRTKGFDKAITPDIVQWANTMLSRTGKVKWIKRALIGSLPGAAAIYGTYKGAQTLAGRNAENG